MLLALVLSTLALIPQPKQVVEKDGCITNPVITEVSDASIPVEGYRLSITSNGIAIVSSTPAGAFYARQTLNQLPQPYPCVEIADAPRFPWRGVLLDESRHFFGKQVVKDILDRMAAYKLNVFHWHLTDSIGWRVQIDHYPRLTEIGAERPIPDWCKLVSDDHVAMTTGRQFYTKDDLREIVAYAEARHIRIVPEFDIPGHSRAAILSYPQLSCLPFKEVLDFMRDRDWKTGHPRAEALCPGRDFTLEFCKNVLDEFLEIFSDPVIHIGGDECNKLNWQTCPDCQARMKAHNLKTVEELQSWFVCQMVDYLASKGRHALGWEEILQGGLAPGAYLMSWHGAECGKTAAKAGHYVLMCPAKYCYLDGRTGLPNDNNPYPIFSKRVVTLETTYAFNPLEGLTPEEQKFVLGSETLNWTEATWNIEQLNYKMWPRTCANAEILWTGPGVCSFEDFQSRLLRHRKAYP